LGGAKINLNNSELVNTTTS